MKILMIANGMDIGGAETHVLELCTALSEKGHSLTVASPFGAYTKELRKRGIAVKKIRAYDGTFFSFTKQLSDLFCACRCIAPDVLHAHTRPGALCAVLIGKMLSIPVVSTAHLPFEKRKICEKSTRWGDRVLAVSEDIKRYLIDHYSIADSDIDIIRNGIDTDRFVPNGGIARKAVHVSRLDADRSKTAKLLISIAPELAEANVCQEIVIVGDGDCFRACQQMQKSVNEKIGKEYVRMLGARTDIERLLANRPVFIGVSRAALEAMACECSVILCGNEGYGGILDEEKAHRALRQNFCCRNHKTPTKKQLLRDINSLLQKTDKERLALGKSMRKTAVHVCQRDNMAEIAETAYKAVARKKQPGIMLCGYYGYGNVGDETVLPMILQKCKRYTERITVMSRNPHKDQRRYGVKCIGRYSLLGFMNSFHCGDILIFGGGNLFQNQTSQRSLIYYLTVALLSKIKKGKIAIVRGGIGELHGSYSQKAVGMFLKNCDYISCRTHGDLEEIKNYGVFPKIKLSADGALFLSEIGKEGFPLSLPMPYCLVVLKRATKKETVKKTQIIKKYCQTHGLKTVFLAFDEQEDMKTIKAAASMIGDSIVLNSKKNQEIQKIIRNSQIVLTDRLHAAYFAFMANRPFAFLEKNEKNLRHIHYIKSSCQKAKISSEIMVDLTAKSDFSPLPLSVGEHSRVLAYMIGGNRQR